MNSCAYGVLVKSDMPYRELIITHSVSATPEREGGDHTDSVSGPNLRTIGALQRSFRSQYDNCYYRYLTVDLLRFKGNLLNPLVFCDSSFSGGTDPTLGVTNGSHLDDGLVYRKMVDEFAPPSFLVYRGMKHDHCFLNFMLMLARQMSLSAKVRMRAEYNVKETRRLKSVVERQDELLKVREGEIENLKTQLLLREAEAAEAIRLRAEAYKFEAVEKSLQDEMNALKERELADLNALVTSIKSQNDNLVDRVHELETSFSGLQEKMALHLEENFYPHLLTTISGHRWLLTHGMELAIVKCLNLPEYPSALRTVIGKAIEKGMQDGLAVGIAHGKKGTVLTDVAAHNPSAEVDYVSALQQLQPLNFPLLAELKSNKDASVKTMMDILHLEDPVAEKLGLNELQPNVDQLMVPIHSSLNRVVIGATALSLALDVSSSKPFLAAVLMSTEGTSNIVSATINTTMTLSMTFASTGLVVPIFVDDYEVVVFFCKTISLLFGPTRHAPLQFFYRLTVDHFRLGGIRRSEAVPSAPLTRCIHPRSCLASPVYVRNRTQHRLASMSFAYLSKQVMVEELKEKSISEVEILAVVEEEGNTWMTPIFEYLTEKTLSADVKKARAVRRKSQ
ncbi:hypothetical protein Tco_0570573 [Tanacetum coccineum]